MATTLSYSNSDFVPFTTIKSADVNQKFSDIKSRLNWAGGTDATTGLGDDNIQSNTASGGGLTRSTKLKAGTANFAVYNDSNGKLTEAASLPSASGGLGFVPTVSVANAGKVVGVNDAGSSLELRSPEASVLVEQLAGNVATLTSGQVLAVNDAVCLDLIDGQYRVMKSDYTNGTRLSSFLGFSLNVTTATAQVTTLTKASAWTSGTIIVTVNGRTYSKLFLTSNDASMTALAALIAADQDVTSAAAGASPINVITVTMKGSLTATITCNSSGGAPTLTPATTTTAVGGSVRIQAFGPLSGFSALTVGALYYIDATTAGAITASPPATQVFVGQAISTTVLFISPNKFNLAFTGTNIFFRSHGGSTGNTAANFTASVEHYDLTSAWVTGTADSVNRSGLHNGSGVLSGFLVVVDGNDAAGSLQNTTRKYNKSSWVAGTARTTARNAGGVAPYIGLLYFGLGTTGADSNKLDSYNGTSWSNSFATSSVARRNTAGFTQGGFLRFVGGSASDAHDKYDGASLTTDTLMPSTAVAFGGSQSASGLGLVLQTNAATTTTAYTYNGTAWSGSIAIGYTIAGDNSVGEGPSTGYDSANAMVYHNGGTSALTTSITTTSKYNGTSFSTTTASSTARAGAQAGIG